MAGPLELTASRIGVTFNLSSIALSQSLQRISSGKKYLQPRDGIGEFMSVQRIQRDRRGYQIIRDGLANGRSVMGVAEAAGTEIVDTIKRMKELVADYWDSSATATGQAAARGEFDQLAANINRINSTTTIDGRALFQAGTLMSMMVDPNDPTQTLDITFAAGDLVDATPGAMTIDDGVSESSTMAAIDAELDSAMTYIAKVSGYMQSIDSQIAIGDSVIENGSAYESTLNGVDDARELSNVVTHEIRQRASLSMLSQGNMIRMGILRLFE